MSLRDAGQNWNMQSDGQTASALETYVNYDVSFTDALKKRAAAEAAEALSNRALYTSGPTGDLPAYLTPQMQTWVQPILGLRNSALDSVRSAYERIPLKRGATGQCAEIEKAKAKDNFLAQKLRFIKADEADHKSDYQNLETSREEERTLLAAYQQKRAELGDREPKITKTSSYLTMLFGVGVAEALLNYESFAALKWASPAIATGLTILVAIALAWASHCHGTLLKQYEYHFGNHRDDSARSRGRRLFAIGTTLFLTALAIVFYARNSFIADFSYIDALQNRNSLNALWTVGGAILGNIVVYLVGVVIAYWLHDADPEYPEKKKELDRATAAKEKIQAKISARRQREFERLHAKLRADEVAIENVEKQVRKSSEAETCSAMLTALRRKDDEVEAVLRDYRTELIRQITEQDGSTIFFVIDDEGHEQPIDSARFSGLPIELKLGYV